MAIEFVHGHRLKALVRLWSDVARGIEVQHPDPDVSVEIDVSPHESVGYVEVQFRMNNLHDTSDRDLLLSPPSLWQQGWGHDLDTAPRRFSMVFRTSCWPGRQLAEVALVSAWTTYVQHEAVELVHRRGAPQVDRWEAAIMGSDPARVIDPHDFDAFGWERQDQLIRDCFYGHSLHDVAEIIGALAGDEKARRYLTRAIPDACREVDVEERWIREGGEWQ